MNMKFEEKLKAFAKKYNLKYAKQEFYNAHGDGWYVQTYSIYNDAGCFTIHYLLQRCEYDFYYSNKFSNTREDLMQKTINVFDYEKNTWKKKSKICGKRSSHRD